MIAIKSTTGNSAEQRKRIALVANILGVAAILSWAVTVPAIRIAQEELGTLTAAGLSALLSGVLLTLFATIRSRGFGWIRQLERKHLLFCGPLFVAYFCSLYFALGLAHSRVEALSVGLVNYLWPSLVLLFSIPLLGRRPRKSVFCAGLLLVWGGVLMAWTRQRSAASGDEVGAFGFGVLPIVLALVASITWALYSNLARLFRQRDSVAAVGVFFLVTSCAFLSAGGIRIADAQWNFRSVLALAVLSICSMSLAYVFWDTAMRDGDLVLLGALANTIPVLSIAVGTAWLGVRCGGTILGAAALIALGTAICWASFRGLPSVLTLGRTSGALDGQRGPQQPRMRKDRTAVMVRQNNSRTPTVCPERKRGACVYGRQRKLPKAGRSHWYCASLGEQRDSRCCASS